MSALDKLQQTLRFVDDNLHRFDYKKLCDIYSRYLPRLPFSITEFDNKPCFFNQREYGGLNIVYRAQVIRELDKAPHNTVARLSYMPNDKLHLLTSYGRVNKPGQAMFYGAFSPTVAAFEALHGDDNFIAKHSAFVTVGTWQFIEPMTLADIIISQEQHDRLHRELPDSFKSKYDEDYFKRQHKWLNERKFTDLERCVYEYFASKFCESSENNLHYLASNYYADRIFNLIEGHSPSEDGVIDGILYPSVAGTYQAQNIVLTPEAVNSKLKFMCAQHFVVFGGSSFQLGPLDRARSDDEGNLIWNKEEWHKQQAEQAK